VDRSLRQIPAAISQGRSEAEARENLKDAISLILDVRHTDFRACWR
jgi:predicted RNase H-like HicB family nuclease